MYSIASRVRNLSSAAAWSVAAGMVSQGASLLVVFVLARNLGTEEYGRYSYLIMIAAFFSSFCSSGINISATVNVSALVNRRNALIQECQRFYSLGWLLSLASALIYLIFAIFAFYSSSGDVSISLANHMLLSIYIFTVGFDSMQLGIAFGLGVFRKLAVANLVKATILLTLMIFASSWGSHSNVLMALALSWSLNLAINKTIIENHLGVKFTFFKSGSTSQNRRWLIRVFTFSSPLVLSALITSGSIVLSNHMASSLVNGFLLVGIAALGRQWIFIHQFIPAQISNMVLPKLIRLRSDSSSFKRGSNLYLLSSAALGILIGALAAAVAWALRSSALESLELEFSSVLIFIVAGFLAVINNTLGYVLVSFGNTRARLRADVVMGTVLLTATYFLLKYEPSVAIPWAIALGFLAGVAELMIEFVVVEAKSRVA